MHLLPFWTIKTVDFTHGSRKITLRSDVTYHKPCNITLCCRLLPVVISAPVDGHMGQSEDAYLQII